MVMGVEANETSQSEANPTHEKIRMKNKIFVGSVTCVLVDWADLAWTVPLVGFNAIIAMFSCPTTFGISLTNTLMTRAKEGEGELEGMKSTLTALAKRGGGRGGAYSFVACLCHLAIDHASFSRRNKGGES